ncbi:hypothetical protein [Pedobacter nyackensis]|uniref:hypothetical protein n=1 Tax=Pedobacter nyackensis TaxID=475255 RepID=UPI002931B660|nr:hypothetical protein [Pedobacter nyackensis]
MLLFSTELQELIKLPLLFQHYFEHKAINEDISFSRYLIDHYNSVPHTDNDEERDSQLPFKSVDKNSVLTSPAVPPSDKFVIKMPTIIVFNSLSIYNDDDVPAAFSGSIWQPPKSLIYSSNPLV